MIGAQVEDERSSFVGQVEAIRVGRQQYRQQMEERACPPPAPSRHHRQHRHRGYRQKGQIPQAHQGVTSQAVCR
jgi:hypothetical protein